MIERLRDTVAFHKKQNSEPRERKRYKRVQVNLWMECRILRKHQLCNFHLLCKEVSFSLSKMRGGDLEWLSTERVSMVYGTRADKRYTGQCNNTMSK